VVHLASYLMWNRLDCPLPYSITQRPAQHDTLHTPRKMSKLIFSEFQKFHFWIANHTTNTLEWKVSGIFKSNLHLNSSFNLYNWKRNSCFPGFATTVLIKAVYKDVVYEYVPIIENTFRSGTTESCVAQRSIYVIMRGNEDTRRYINQVRIVLNHFLSDIIYECI
jgi:hypothetical protein